MAESNLHINRYLCITWPPGGLCTNTPIRTPTFYQALSIQHICIRLISSYLPRQPQFRNECACTSFENNNNLFLVLTRAELAFSR